MTGEEEYSCALFLVGVHSLIHSFTHSLTSKDLSIAEDRTEIGIYKEASGAETKRGLVTLGETEAQRWSQISWRATPKAESQK